MGKAWKQAEREVAKLLQEWWRVLEPQATFMRTPGSGAWATSHSIKGFTARGDILVDPGTCHYWPYSVEIKFRQTVTPASIKHFEEGKKSPINGFWKQCCDAAEKDNQKPFLIFRGNRQPWRASLLGPGDVFLLDDFLQSVEPMDVLRK